MARQGQRAEKHVLTDRVVKSLRPEPGQRRQRVVWDAALPNFGVRISGQGKRQFVLVRRHGGRLVWLSFGEYSSITLADALLEKLGGDSLREMQDNLAAYRRRLAEY